MTLQVGKRYSFSPWFSGFVPKGKRFYDGILASIDQDWAYLVRKNGEEWRVRKEHVLPYRKTKK